MEKLSAVLIVVLFSMPMLGETVVFTAGDNSFEVEFVEIGSPLNSDDPRREYVFDKWGRLSEPYLIGGVDYEYSITKFEMSCEGVKLVRDFELADPPPQGFCNDDGAIGHYPEPINPTRAGEFVNWLNTSSGYPPAYDITTSASRWGYRDWEPDVPGYNPENPTRNLLAKYFIATADEFHKAAYYDPENEAWLDYATEGNVRPLPVADGTDAGTAVVDRVINTTTQQLADVDNAGGLSAFGTMGQTGNIREWEEGFGWFRSGVVEHPVLNAAHASNSRIREISSTAGVRVVAIPPVPEPSSAFLLAIALATLGTIRRRRR